MRKSIYYLLFAVALIAGTGCSSMKKGSSSFSDKSKSATVKPTPKTSEKPQPKDVVVKEERVKVVESHQGEKAGKYYVILGSFKVLENSRNFKQQLTDEGFRPTILENENGLYRVSIASYDEESRARARIADIRARYDKYDDVWLLINFN